MIKKELISEKGYWKTEDEEGHVFDENLCSGIISLLNDMSVIDLGCGTGRYVEMIKNNGNKVTGVDGNPNTPTLSNGLCSIQDITEDFFIDYYDVVISLEVGEHIPKEYQNAYINNVIKHCRKKIIMSWAIPGQGGDGHVNCLPNNVIKEIFKRRGFENNLEQEIYLRNISKEPWFKNTIMVFDQKE